jgi:hypothetical protein
MNLDQKTIVRAVRLARGLLTCLGLLLALRFAAEPALAQTPTIVSYTNTTPITCPAFYFGDNTPYPSVISVPVSGTLQKVTVMLTGVAAQEPNSYEIAIAGPETNVVVDLMYADGTGEAVTNLNLTFDDSASGFLPENGQLVSGTYKPGGTDAEDNPTETTNMLSGFIGTTLNGNWSLYVFDTGNFDSSAPNQISCWSLTFTYIAQTTIQFTNPQLNNLGQFTALLSGPVGTPLVVEGSTDLLNWTPIATNAMATSPVVFTDTNALVHYLFYRAVLLSSLPATVAFATPQINGSGQFQVSLSGPVGTPLVIQTSPDLQTWTPLATNPMTTSPIIFTDTNALSSHLFYRALTNSP